VLLPQITLVEIQEQETTTAIPAIPLFQKEDHAVLLVVTAVCPWYTIPYIRLIEDR
jgi:hypothetical protein